MPKLLYIEAKCFGISISDFMVISKAYFLRAVGVRLTPGASRVAVYIPRNLNSDRPRPVGPP